MCSRMFAAGLPCRPEEYRAMAQALRLAQRGLYTTTPNPHVGCVLLKDGQVISSGWHRKAGEAHAEVIALRASSEEQARGATACVTLEPCAHQGRTPPCTEALIKAKVARVVCAMQDPNPLVAGQGLQTLQKAGIETVCGLMQTQAEELNCGYISRITRQRPYVRLKAAISLDGRMALANGTSQWMTGAAARKDGHRWRARACAILTGVGTVLKDDPRLTVRAVPCERQPLPVVIDPGLHTPTSAALLANGALLYTLSRHIDSQHARQLAACGAQLVTMPASLSNAQHLDWHAVLADLAARGINELHVEAGPGLNFTLLESGCVDELLLYQAPALLGDVALNLTKRMSLESLEQRYQLQIVQRRAVGRDERILARSEQR